MHDTDPVQLQAGQQTRSSAGVPASKTVTSATSQPFTWPGLELAAGALDYPTFVTV